MSPNSVSSAAQARLVSVPPFPPIAAKLLTMLRSDAVEVAELARLIATDAPFCARVLQYANSVEFGLLEPVTNMRQALAIIGLDRTRQITITIAAAAYTKAALRTAELRRCWQHTVATGIIAEQLAKACHRHVDVAYTAGILHDIGRLGLMVAYPREYESAIRHASEHYIDLLDFEQQQFGMHHADAGRWLAEQWGLPEEFRLVAGRHHDTVEGTELTLVRLVHVACRLADFLGYDVTPPLAVLDFDKIMADMPGHVRHNVNLQPAGLRQTVEQAIKTHDGADVDTSSGVLLEAAPPAEDFGFSLPIQEAEPAPSSRHSMLLYTVLFCAVLLTAAMLLRGADYRLP